MQNSDNQNKTSRIYDKGTRKWFKVSPEEFSEYDRWRTRVRKREQYHHRCMCPRSNWWLCDGMCDDCEFHAAGDIVSLDSTHKNKEDDEVSLLDVIASSDSDLMDNLCDQILMQQLLQRLNVLMPEAFEIGNLRIQGLKDEAIADVIGIKRTTFRSRIEKARDILQEEYGDVISF